jgi:hypothetical protein
MIYGVYIRADNLRVDGSNILLVSPCHKRCMPGKEITMFAMSVRPKAALTVLSGLLITGAIGTAAAPQPAAAQQTPYVLYELDYAASGGLGFRGSIYDTVVTVGLPSAATGSCYVAITWYDKKGVSWGTSGPALLTTGAVNSTLNVTSFPNSSQPTAIPPYVLDVFRPTTFEQPFEGFARILSSCPPGTKLRVDAQFAFPTRDQGFGFRPITVTNPQGRNGD